MGFHDRYHTNKGAEENGTWVDLGNGVMVKVRRMNSAHSRATRKRLEEPYKAARKFGADLSQEEEEEILLHQLGESLVLDWRGVSLPSETDPNEEAPIAFSPEAAFDVFSKYPEFRDEVLKVLMDRDTFKKQVAEADAKNS